MDVELIRPGVLVCRTWPQPIRREQLRTSPTPKEFADFARRLGIAEDIKAKMRASYVRSQTLPFDGAQAQAREFFEAYEEINRKWVPEDPCYSGSRSGVALSTTADLWTLTGASSGQLRILEVYIGGEATSSAVNRVALQRAGTVGVTPTSQTPEKFNVRSPAAAATFQTTWGTQPVLGGVPAVILAFNAFGGADRWVPTPGAEIYLLDNSAANQGQYCFRSASGTSTVSSYVIWEEL